MADLDEYCDVKGIMLKFTKQNPLKTPAEPSIKKHTV